MLTGEKKVPTTSSYEEPKTMAVTFLDLHNDIDQLHHRKEERRDDYTETHKDTSAAVLHSVRCAPQEQGHCPTIASSRARHVCNSFNSSIECVATSCASKSLDNMCVTKIQTR